MKKILCIQPLRPEALALLDARDDVSYEVVTDFSAENLMRHAVGVDAITVRDAPLPAEVLALAPGLQVVSRHGVGCDNIPVEWCTARGRALRWTGRCGRAMSWRAHGFRVWSYAGGPC